MEVYLLLIAFIALMTLIGSKCSLTENKRLACVLLVVLTLISGLRGIEIGTDTITYNSLFLYVGMFDNLFDAIRLCGITSPVYVAENWIISSLGGNYHIVLFVNAAIVCSLTGRFIFKTSTNPCFSVLCFVLLAIFFQSMNGMRQYLAIVLVMNAFIDFYDARIRAAILFLVAVLIHTTAVVCLPGFLAVYLLRNWANRRKAMIVTAVASAVLAVCVPTLVELFVQLVPYYSMYDGTNNIDILANDFGGRIALFFLLLMCVCVVDYFVSADCDEGSQACVWERYGIYVFCIIAVVLGLIFCRSFLITRLLWFYLFPFISYIPNVASKLKGGSSILFIELVCSGLFVWCAFQMLENKDEIIPYVCSLFPL